jgi:DNA-binding response OmpR family regulator
VSALGTILVVEDERAAAHMAKTILDEAGFSVRQAKDAEEALAGLKKSLPDVVLLDVELPGMSGFKFLEGVRKDPRTAALPVILLTVLDGVGNKVKGLNLGADDYLVKPYSAKELLARIGTILRRIRTGYAAPEGDAPVDPNLIVSGPIALDLQRWEATVDGKRTRLTLSEFKLLALLIKRKGFVLSYEVLAESLDAESGKETSSEALYAHVKNLRRHLGEHGSRIETVHGIGYKFVEP